MADEQNNQQVNSPLEEMKKLTERNEAAAKKMEEERRLMEKAATTVALSGKGTMQPPERKLTEQEQWEKDAAEKYKGTVLDPNLRRK